MDPVSAQGIGNALRQAEMLSNAIVAAWSGTQALDTALDTYWHRRDDAFTPMYDFTTTLAQLRPLSPANRQLLGALHGRPEEVDRFLGVFAGVTPLRQYRSPGNLVRLLGARGLTRAAVATVGSALRPSAA
jgi:2-polyprenyl-6-methoxyphenol hydroxylase-like FAD-dependent oxidoreductase